jgi:outer membrane protein insertion porin family
LKTCAGSLRGFGLKSWPVPFFGKIVCLIILTLAGFCTAANSQIKTAQSKAVARKSPPIQTTSWKLLAIHVDGSQRYTSDEIVAESGLQAGQTASEDDFKKASERLGETGVFSNVSYTFDYSSEGAKLNLQVSDNEQFVPARFDNLVWFSEQELLDKLRARVPFFKGTLPVGGGLADEVSDALQALLIEHKVQGKADYLREAPRDGPINSFLFTVSAHAIHIHNVEFTGATPEQWPPLHEAAKRMIGSEYSHTAVQEEEKLGFQPIYKKRGYLKAHFDSDQVKIVQDGEQETTVDVVIAVAPGLQYKLTGVHWSGNKAFPNDQLQSFIKLKKGEPADAVQLDDDLRRVANLYGTRGYMAPQLQPTPNMDDSTSTVSYGIEVKEGDVYKMGELDIRGLDSKAKGRMIFDWKMAEGDVYDSSYIARFLAESAKDLPANSKWMITPNEAINEDQTVDVTLRYETKPQN